MWKRARGGSGSSGRVRPEMRVGLLCPCRDTDGIDTSGGVFQYQVGDVGGHPGLGAPVTKRGSHTVRGAAHIVLFAQF